MEPLYSSVRLADGTRDVFCAYYTGVKCETMRDVKQIEADARLDAPNWGVEQKIKFQWFERPIPMGGLRARA